jgi:hypothetical protein
MPKESLLAKYDLPQFTKIVEAVKGCSHEISIPNNMHLIWPILS